MLHLDSLHDLPLLVLSVWLLRRTEWESQGGHGILEGKGSSQRKPTHRP